MHDGFVLALLLLTTPIPAPALEGWQQILATRVSERGLVDYRKIASEDRAKLDAFLDAVASAAPPKDRGEAIALYADAYNALVIRKVIDAKLPRSVLDVKGFFDKDTVKVAGQTVTLDALEKKIVGPLANPGHHFILVCAAVGCPRLTTRSFLVDAAKIDERMTAAARAYLATPRGAVAAEGRLSLSKIFEWYAADFGGSAGVLAFARAHLPPEALVKIGATPKVESLEYDWTLNQP